MTNAGREALNPAPLLMPQARQRFDLAQALGIGGFTERQGLSANHASKGSRQSIPGRKIGGVTDYGRKSILSAG
jgi:hypothetical protein